MSKFFRNMLVSRGYFDQAGDGTGTGAGAGAGGDAAATDAAKSAADADAAAKSAADAAEAAARSGSGISDAEAKLLKEVMDKKNALKKASEDLLAIKDQLKRFDGIDPDVVKVMLDERKAAETKQLEAKGEWERLKSQMADEHGKEKLAISDQLITAQTENDGLKRTISELTIGNSFSQSPFIRDELALTTSKARVVYGSHFEFSEGQIVGFDKPTGEKNRTMLVDAKGDALSFELAMKKIVEADPDRDQLIKSKMKPGASSFTTKKTTTPDSSEDLVLTGKERIAAALTAANAKK